MQCDIRGRRKSVYWNRSERGSLSFSQSARGSQKFTSHSLGLLSPAESLPTHSKVWPQAFGGSEQCLQSLKKFSYHTDPQKQSIKLK